VNPSPLVGLVALARGLTYLVYAFVIVALIVLVLGFFLLLLGANPEAAFAEWSYRALDRVMAPFRGLFESIQINGESVLDVSVLFAMIVYGIVALALGGLIEWLSQRLAAMRSAASERDDAAASPPP